MMEGRGGRSKEAGKEQYLIPYFIAAHPGTTDEDMLNLALWLKKNGFRADQVQAFYPSPMATATAMFHTDKNPLKKVTYKSERVESVKDPGKRKLHKALLRYHDPNNWPLLRNALRPICRAMPKGFVTSACFIVTVSVKPPPPTILIARTSLIARIWRRLTRSPHGRRGYRGRRTSR
jgi:hypothetical protein